MAGTVGVVYLKPSTYPGDGLAEVFRSPRAELVRLAAFILSDRGSYDARFTAPAGRKVTLRVTALDAAGGQVSETITRAYATAPRPGTPR